MSKEDMISALYLSADILEYPQGEYIKKIDELYSFTTQKPKHFDVSYLQSEHIRIFNMDTLSLRCVPFASWWIDGKMGGVSYQEIESFYEECGFVLDRELIKKPSDHISLMLTFAAMLLEEGRFEEIERFARFLNWLDDFADSLDKASKIDYFRDAVNISNMILNSFKERR